MNPLLPDSEALRTAITAMEANRALLGDAVVDLALSVLREKLASLEKETTGQRREVSVLAAILSVPAGEPGEELIARMDALVQRFGGRTAAHTGETFLAWWGWQAAREHDPEQAVRAALELFDETRTFQKDRNQEVSLRIGVHTGRAPVDSISGAASLGDAAGTEPFVIAEQLLRTAPPGRILISHDTFLRVRGIFDVDPFSTLDVKGRFDPVPVYVVNEVYARPFHSERLHYLGGVETRMVGRDAELLALKDAFDSTLRDHRRRVVSICGEAGIGKSRLLDEFEKWLDLHPLSVYLFQGRAERVSQTVPFALMRDVLFTRFEIMNSDPPETVHQKIELGVSAALGPRNSTRPRNWSDEEIRERAHFIGHLLGVDFSTSPYLANILSDARLLRDRGIICLQEYFESMAAEYPLVMLLEDIHWADDSSLDLLETMLRQEVEQRVLLACTALPALSERRPVWAAQQPLHTRLALQPLSGADSRRLVEEILQRVDSLPLDLSDLISRSTGGSPYYVEELIRLLIEDGVILRDPGGMDEGEIWHVAMERLAVVRIPATLEGVLEARLDGLSSAARNALHRAAAVGSVFWDTLVAGLAISTRDDGQALGQTLEELERQEMIYLRQSSSFQTAREYLFSHTLLREAAWENMRSEEREVYHGRVAGWMAGQVRGRVGEFAALVANHFDQAGDRTAAVDWYQIAGQQASARSGTAEALRCYNRALALITNEFTPRRYDLLAAREQALDLLDQREQQFEDLETLDLIAQQLNDPHRQAEVALRRASYAIVTGKYDQAGAAAQRAADISQSVGVRARAGLSAGHALMRQGRAAEAQARLQETLTLAREGRLTGIEAEALRMLAGIASEMADYPAAGAAYQQALRSCQATGDRRGEATTLYAMGELALDQGDYLSARAYHEQDLQIRRETGDRRGVARASSSLAYIARELGEYGASTDLYLQAVDVFRETGDRHSLCMVLRNLGRDAAALGDFGAARSYMEQALEIQRQLSDRQGESISLDDLSRVCLALGDTRQAFDYSRQALDLMNRLRQREMMGRAMYHLGCVLAGMGSLTDAETAFQRAHGLAEELGENGLAAEARAGLASVLLQGRNVVGALSYVLDVLDFLKTGTDEGLEEPFRLYFTCYQVLRAAREPRALDVLREGFRKLQARAERILGEDARVLYLNIPVHRELITNYQMLREK